ncbi:prephenate dehydratase [Demequina sp. B12]|uniref:prephenate dehydratase n=1 Tax=Demequina sp. B12 TaxID=2992757 RepID=UPI00237A5336|nr:prephenate dehydratase [Demequina sp. B12]MDE0572027.1 prephenate dehydratase [Demequina sp. B12]
MTALPRYAYLGPAGTFTEAALRTMASPQEAEYVPCVDVVTALGALRAGEVDYAVVAIENTVEGGVTATLDTLATGEPLVILGETVLPIAFELLVRPGTELADITAVSAHSHAWAQVRRWANSTLPDVAFVASSSNAAAARDLANESLALDDLGFNAALAPPGTGAATGLTVLADRVADNVSAATRFVKVGRPRAIGEPTGSDKTTIVVHLPTDQAGALLRMLEQFSVRGVNLSRIESRPIGERPGEYSFSIDVLGHVGEARVAEALVGLKRTCPVVRFLGSYPKADSEVNPVDVGTGEEAFDQAHSWVDSLRKGNH